MLSWDLYFQTFLNLSYVKVKFSTRKPQTGNHALTMSLLHKILMKKKRDFRSTSWSVTFNYSVLHDQNKPWKPLEKITASGIWKDDTYFPNNEVTNASIVYFFLIFSNFLNSAYDYFSKFISYNFCWCIFTIVKLNNQFHFLCQWCNPQLL